MPLAVLTKGRAHDEAFAPPEWWRWLAHDDAEPTIAERPPVSEDAAPSPEPASGAPAPADSLPEAVAAALKHVPAAMQLAVLVETSASVDLTMASVHLGTTISEVRSLVGTANVLLDQSQVGRNLITAGDQVAWSFVMEPAPVSGGESWLDGVDNTADRAVLQHLNRHGSITQRDLEGLVGSARKARRFAAQVEVLSTLAPFRIVVEPLPDGTKRYSTLKD